MIIFVKILFVIRSMIIVSEFLLLCNFFIGLIILIVELGIISDLQDLRADLYYYSEQKSDGEKDELLEPF